MLAALRVAAGLSFTLAPRSAGSLLVGGDARAPGARLFIRAFGVRDVVLGAGTWHSLSSSGSAGLWLGACVLANAFDAAATLRQFDELPRGLRTLTLAVSLAPAVAGAAVVWSAKR